MVFEPKKSFRRCRYLINAHVSSGVVDAHAPGVRCGRHRCGGRGLCVSPETCLICSVCPAEMAIRYPMAIGLSKGHPVTKNVAAPKHSRRRGVSIAGAPEHPGLFPQGAQVSSCLTVLNVHTSDSRLTQVIFTSGGITWQCHQ